MADSQLMHLLMVGASLLGSLLGSAIRGTRLDPRLDARIRWVTRAVKSVAAHVRHKLDPEPLIDQLDEARDTSPGRRF